MSSSATAGSGCVLKIGDGEMVEAFTEIPEVRGLRGPGLSGGVVDVTSFTSPNQMREFIGTLRDAGSLSFTMNYRPSDTIHQQVISDWQNKERRNFEFVFSDSGTTTMSFTGYITGVEISAELEQPLTASVTIKVTGWPTWA